MHLRTITVSSLLALCLLVPSFASAASTSELEAQIKVLLNQLAELRRENPTAEVTDIRPVNGPTVEVISPNGGESYVAGSNDSLTVSWRARKIPKDSTVCVTLVPEGKDGGFLWGDDGCITAKNGIRKITSKLIITDGYDLAVGTYRVRVAVSGKSEIGEKDAPIIAQDDSDETFELTGDETEEKVTVREERYGIENPTFHGSAEWVSSFGISVDNGDKVYGSGNDAIDVSSSGRWSHKISTDLRNGEYNVQAYNNKNVLIGTGKFSVQLDNTPPTTDTGTTASDGYTPSPTSGKKPLLVTFTGTINAKKSCGGGTYTLAFGDGTTYSIQFPADLCGVQTFTTTHTYSKDGSYMSGLYLGKLSSGNLVARRLIQVSTPEETPSSSTTNTTTSGSTTTTPTTTSDDDSTESTSDSDSSEETVPTRKTRTLGAAAYLAIEKQLEYLAEQIKLLMEDN